MQRNEAGAGRICEGGWGLTGTAQSEFTRFEFENEFARVEITSEDRGIQCGLMLDVAR